MNMNIFNEMAKKAVNGKPILDVCIEEIESLRRQIDAKQTELSMASSKNQRLKRRAALQNFLESW